MKTINEQAKKLKEAAETIRHRHRQLLTELADYGVKLATDKIERVSSKEEIAQCLYSYMNTYGSITEIVMQLRIVAHTCELAPVVGEDGDAYLNKGDEAVAKVNKMMDDLFENVRAYTYCNP